MAGNDIGIECPRYIARAVRFKGVMVSDFSIMGGASGLIGIGLSEIHETMGWLVGLGLAIMSWLTLKALTDGKHDGTFNLWLHKKKISKLKSFPTPVASPIRYGMDLPSARKQNGLMKKFVRAEQKEQVIWSRGLNPAYDSDWMRQIDREKSYNKVTASFYTELGHLQKRITRLTIIRWGLIAYIGYLFMYDYNVSSIQRPPYYFKGMPEAGIVEVEYVENFDKEQWLRSGDEESSGGSKEANPNEINDKSQVIE